MTTTKQIVMVTSNATDYRISPVGGIFDLEVTSCVGYSGALETLVQFRGLRQSNGDYFYSWLQPTGYVVNQSKPTPTVFKNVELLNGVLNLQLWDVIGDVQVAAATFIGCIMEVNVTPSNFL